MSLKNIKLSDLPEEVAEDGTRTYGTTSYETQVALLSHYLHSLDGKHDIESGERRHEILGGKCVYSSEFDAQAQKTYMANYGEMPFWDITKCYYLL